MNIRELLEVTNTRDASDLHLVSEYTPTLRIQGELHELVTFPKLLGKDIEVMIFEVLSPAQKELLLQNRELDFSTSLEIGEEIVRFRANAYYQKGTLAVSFRRIPSRIPTIEELSLPTLLHEFAKLKQGFILLTGASGQGKSTTLASIIAEINLNRKTHIITIEDPIEYVYPKGKAMISQKELYQDTHSWDKALKNVLREDPDVVYIGEMRDFDTISSALTIAETGHLVFSTLHTNSAAQTVDRIIDIFPASAKEQVRLQLSMVLSGVVTQRLVPSILGKRIPVCEILLGSPSIKNIIREGKTHLIDNTIQTSQTEGMLLFEEDLKQKVEKQLITPEIAVEYALRPDRYLQMMER
ncbi:PilT/PilU family type 4a pilus ATPase [Candidatus Gottesmanbacteria bacterium]|nr:PilT/PilU family type 4a pilus ATPase [Candidatus Gottesmanbacteria bacterium]